MEGLGFCTLSLNESVFKILETPFLEVNVKGVYSMK